MKPVSIHQAKTHLSRLIARAEAGEEVIIRRHQTPVARLVAYEAAVSARSPGSLRGEIELAADFDSPLEDFEPYTAR
ncbi:MAG: type II toxin-antitoxin system prevent-host-death family antitoxin [Solirubrobacterales bacterium]